MEDQQIVRVVLSRLDTSVVTMSERMLPELDAFETFQAMAKALTGREIKRRPLEVRPAEPRLAAPSRRGRLALVGLVCVAAFALMTLFTTMTYHNGYRVGYDQGAADVRRAYGAK